MFKPLSDLLALDLTQYEWLVEGLIPKIGLTGIFGAPKVGKSTFTQELAFRVAQGQPFLGRPTIQTPVSYVLAEGSLTDFQLHFVQMGAKGKEEFYYCAEQPPFRFRSAPWEFVPQGLLVLDTFQLSCPVEDTNNYAMVTGALYPFIELARRNEIAVVITHHTNKSESAHAMHSIMGSNAFWGAMDSTVVLSQDRKSKTPTQRWVESSQRVGNDLPKTKLIFNSKTRTFSLGSKVEKDYPDRILSVLREAGPLTLTELRARAKMDKNGVRPTLEALELAGDVRQTEDGKWEGLR